jgi:hypothetical protein
LFSPGAYDTIYHDHIFDMKCQTPLNAIVVLQILSTLSHLAEATLSWYHLLTLRLPFIIHQASFTFLVGQMLVGVLRNLGEQILLLAAYLLVENLVVLLHS